MQATSTLYLANRTDGKAGTGTQADPYDAGISARFDAILARSTPGTVYQYAPGVYPTSGWQFRKRGTSAAGCVHRGSSQDQTIIRLSNASGNGDGVIFGCDYDVKANGFELHDLCLDVNAPGQPGWKTGASFGAINCQGNDVLIRGCKVIGFGTSKPGAECFPVFMWPGQAFASQTFSNMQVRDCTFTQPATGNKDGLSACCVGCDSVVTLANCAIAGCSFVGLESDFAYSHAFSAPLCWDNFVNGCGTGYYREPADVDQGAWVIDNAFVDVQIAAQVSIHPGGGFGHLEFSGNTVILREPGYSAAVNVTSFSPPGQPVAVQSLSMSHNQVSGLAVEIHKRTKQGPAPAPQYRAIDLRCPDRNLVIRKLAIERNVMGSAMPNGYELNLSANTSVLPDLHIGTNWYADGKAVPVKREG